MGFAHVQKHFSGYYVYTNGDYAEQKNVNLVRPTWIFGKHIFPYYPIKDMKGNSLKSIFSRNKPLHAYDGGNAVFEAFPMI